MRSIASEVDVEALEKAGKPLRAATDVLALRKNKTIGWEVDTKWEYYMKLRHALPGEELVSKL